MYALVASEGELDGFSMDDADTVGVALLYSEGGGLLLACAWVLLLALLVVLELTRGGGRGALRAVRGFLVVGVEGCSQAGHLVVN